MNVLCLCVRSPHTETPLRYGNKMLYILIMKRARASRQPYYMCERYSPPSVADVSHLYEYIPLNTHECPLIELCFFSEGERAAV